MMISVRINCQLGNNPFIITTTATLFITKQHEIVMSHQHGNKLYWTKEKCLSAAKQCTTIKEFSAKYPAAYIKSITHGYRKDYIWLERTVKLDLESPIYVVYAYQDTFNKVCYIGLTKDLIKRKSSHKKTRYYKDKNQQKYLYRDSVNKYFYENNMPIPNPIVLEEHLTALKAQEQEKYWCDYYHEHGWKLLNKAKTGRHSSSLGGCETKWTYEALKQEALKYNNKNEFNKKKNSAYKIARIAGYLEDFFPSGFENLEGEEWKDVPAYEGLYQISNFKRVKHLKDETHKVERLIAIIKHHKNDSVSLYKNGRPHILNLEKIFEQVWG